MAHEPATLNKGLFGLVLNLLHLNLNSQQLQQLVCIAQAALALRLSGVKVSNSHNVTCLLDQQQCPTLITPPIAGAKNRDAQLLVSIKTTRAGTLASSQSQSAMAGAQQQSKLPLKSHSNFDWPGRQKQT